MDTNVFIALFSGDADASPAAQEALEEARAGGPLGISRPSTLSSWPAETKLS